MAVFSLLTSNPAAKRCCFSIALRLMSAPSASLFYCSTKSCERPGNKCRLPGKTPPVPKKIPFSVSAHGMTWNDPYRWMRNTGDPDFVEYLKQENSYAQAFMADTETLQRNLVTEMKSRMPAKVSTPPESWGPWLYYQYIPEGKEYPVLCRSPATDRSSWLDRLICRARGKQEILLDWNQIAEQYGYVHVGACRVSPDHSFIAYTLDITGGERFLLRIKDLRSGCMLSSSENEGVVGLAWAQDSRTLFYTVSDENQRPRRVLCKKIQSGRMKGIPVFSENDPNFCVDITSTKDGKFVTVYVIDTTNPLAGLQRVRKRVPNVQYFLEHHDGFFYILTNAPLSEKREYEGGGYYLARCLINDVHTSEWQTVIAPNDDITLQDMDMFNNHMVLFLNKNGVMSLCSINMPINIDCKYGIELEDLNPWYFPLPPSTCSCAPGSNLDFMSSSYRVVLSSPVIPDMIVDYDMSRRLFSIVQQEDVPAVEGTCVSDTYKQLQSQNDGLGDNWCIGLHDWKDFSDMYVCDRREVTSHDGIKVPLTILYSPIAWKKAESFGVLLGYGAYGEELDRSWCPNRLSLLNRGWVLAFADVRGGAGSDSMWHKSGCGMFKQNSIQDFVSCAQYLTDNGYVHRHRLCAIGYSAGGTLVGAAINMHPDLFRSAILKVPFLDVLSTLFDPSLPLTVLDYDEFGNPQKLSDFHSILSYSPYENIHKSVCYPSMLVSTSFNDSRVGVWEAAKWVAKVRDITCSSCSTSVVLKTNMTGGHFGEGGRYIECEETAYDYAYLMKASGFLQQWP